ncbi:zinc finger protein 501-like [Hetaerina americana]|uniref:zinc finger protein 501-like n=1 Tax=Hetaerina americana TaxID=62018 RepID=UPI003A7F382F
MVASMQEGCSHWSDNEKAENLLPDKTKEELCEDPIVSDSIDKRAVDVPDDVIIVKEEADTTSECSASPVRDIESLMVASMQEGCSHWSDNEKVGNLDRLEDDELNLSSNVKVVMKEELDVDVPQEKRCLGVDLSQAQDGDEGQDGTGKEGGQEENGAGNLQHKCQACNEVVREGDLLEGHVMRVHPKKEMQFKCDICCDLSKCKSGLHEHVKSVPSLGREYQCQQCSRLFQNTTELQIHMSTHTLERPFKCEKCWKVFAEKANLRKHILTHTREKTHKCELCSKAFSLKGDLKRHIGTHTGEKKYKCRTCSKAFVQKGALQRHMSTHTGEKSYICEVCSKTFSQIGNLRRHQWTHTDEKQYKCMICSKEFSRKHYLESHSLTHSDEPQYKCAICSKEFKRQSDLSRHKKHHIETIIN